MKAIVYVTLKPGVLDPQGEAVKKSLHVLGYNNVDEVRMGKFIELNLQADDMDKAKQELAEMSDKLLANPVIENFRVEIVEGI
ncbi:phosphoribosylformylglycinamidine synthase subunit PurS [Syntrophomonas palmitatica]|uniref:phosphoribosylformylglycinamidine synthase subunit PurS n=1 Tax=Syntrophomonas palmitatica TaxID=402877 RepID=UPI000A9C3798|nr:phosphoribosylformylglycinamidine synthase subunit PurS [Syntrophomonas palmitatica]